MYRSENLPNYFAARVFYRANEQQRGRTMRNNHQVRRGWRGRLAWVGLAGALLTLGGCYVYPAGYQGQGYYGSVYRGSGYYAPGYYAPGYYGRGYHAPGYYAPSY